MQAWAERTETPWESVVVAWYRGPRTTRGGVSQPGLWHTPGWPPVEIRVVSVCEPAGRLRMAALFWTDLRAPPGPIRAWIVRRWSVEVTVEEARAHRGVETQRPWSEQASARSPPVLLALFARVTLRALRLSPDGPSPAPVPAWYHKAEPTFADCLALGRRHRWRARYVVHSPPGAESRQFPQEALALLIHGLPLAAELATVESKTSLRPGGRRAAS